jgi:hypothetical protein
MITTIPNLVRMLTAWTTLSLDVREKVQRHTSQRCMALSNVAFQVVTKGKSLDFQTLRCPSTCRFPITLNGRLSSRRGTVQKQRGTALCETSICLRSRLLTSASLALLMSCNLESKRSQQRETVVRRSRVMTLDGTFPPLFFVK